MMLEAALAALVLVLPPTARSSRTGEGWPHFRAVISPEPRRAAGGEAFVPSVEETAGQRTSVPAVLQALLHETLPPCFCTSAFKSLKWR